LKVTDSIANAMKSAGLDPDALKAPRGKKKAKPSGYPDPCDWKFAPGTLLVHFEVGMRPVPWKSPTVTRSGVSFKDANLKRWQKEVRDSGARAMKGGPYSCRVELVMDFHLTPRAGSAPDVSNLTKATEDALQGPVIVNDRQVGKITSRRVDRSDRDRAEIWVYSAGEESS
jgi:Holliday junction resolvase RusA-like endonuclease